MKSVRHIRLLFCAVGCLVATNAMGQAASTEPSTAPVQQQTIYLMDRAASQGPAELPILGREVYRQALLIAARDELGVATRDGSLREWSSPPPKQFTWNFVTDPAELKVIDPDEKVVWNCQFDKPGVWQSQFLAGLKRAESLSHREFVELLKQHGFSGKKTPDKKEGPVSPDAEKRLGELDELSQFAALRVLHDQIARDGESEARLGALVRAYANLGQLTRSHWSVEPQVFAARSLLYAQHMVTVYANSPSAHWHLAYAMAMAGLQGETLNELAEARKVDAAATMPGWATLLEPFGRYDLGKLVKIAGDHAELKPLALYLGYLSVQYSISEGAIFNTASAALDANPHCLRLIDGMCDLTGPGLLNGLIEDGPQRFSQMLGQELAQMPALPSSIAAAIRQQRRAQGNPQGREVICQALIQASNPSADHGEPSWAVLGREIQETTFAQARRKAYVIAEEWGVDASDFASEVRPLVSDHPFAKVIEVYGNEHQRDNLKIEADLTELNSLRANLAELPLYSLSRRLMPESEWVGWLQHRMILTRDRNSFDNERWLAAFDSEFDDTRIAPLFAELTGASPQSPWLICDDIANHWDVAKAPAWEAAHKGYPLVEWKLGHKYKDLHLWANARACFEAYIAVSPDYSAYYAISGTYLQEGRKDLWAQTQQRYLDETQPLGLEHAQVQSELAQYFMDQRQCAKAVPYADAAAQTGSSFGLRCAARAHTCIGDFDRAEQLYIEDYQHYDRSPYMWYAWCVLSGHGQREAATKSLSDYFATRVDHLTSEDLLQQSLLDGTTGKPADAVAKLKQRYEQGPGPLSLMYIIMWADEAGNKSERDAAITLMRHRVGPTSTMAFGQSLAIAYSGDDFYLGQMEKILAEEEPDNQCIFCAMVGRYMMKHGRKPEAIEYLRRSLSYGAGKSTAELVAAATLREAGIDPLSIIAPDLKAPATRPATVPSTARPKLRRPSGDL